MNLMKKYLLLLSMIVVVGCNAQKPVCSNKTVQKIGGCNKNGYCGVSFTDGTVGGAYLPVEGTTVNYCICANGHTPDTNPFMCSKD